MAGRQRFQLLAPSILSARHYTSSTIPLHQQGSALLTHQITMGPLNLQLLALFVLGCYVATGGALAQPGLVNTAVYDVVQPLDDVTDGVTNTLDTSLASEPEDTQKQTDNKHISYGALQRNTVPCSRRGASYYNCKQGGEANKYQRGCSAITQCMLSSEGPG